MSPLRAARLARLLGHARRFRRKLEGERFAAASKLHTKARLSREPGGLLLTGARGFRVRSPFEAEGAGAPHTPRATDASRSLRRAEA